MKNLIPFILIIAGAGVFFGYTNPTFQNKIKVNQASLATVQKNVSDSESLLQKRDILLKKMSGFKEEDIQNLKKLLPDTIDNVRLVIDLDDVARRYGTSLTDLNLTDISTANPQTVSAGSDQNYQSVALGFSVTMPYEKFILFIRELEQSLRVLDITSISFSSTQSGLYKFGIQIKTYWLK